MDDKQIHQLCSELKPLSTPNDLKEFGLIGSVKNFANMRSEGRGPDYLMTGRGRGTVRYPRASVEAWLISKNSLQIKERS